MIKPIVTIGLVVAIAFTFYEPPAAPRFDPLRIEYRNTIASTTATVILHADGQWEIRGDLDEMRRAKIYGLGGHCVIDSLAERVPQTEQETMLLLHRCAPFFSLPGGQDV